MTDDPDDEKGWRSKPLKDGTFVEGEKSSGEHLHYDSRGGSDIPVHWRNEKTGEGVDLRSKPLGEAIPEIEKKQGKESDPLPSEDSSPEVPDPTPVPENADDTNTGDSIGPTDSGDDVESGSDDDEHGE